jgi:hypothetical protein
MTTTASEIESLHDIIKFLLEVQTQISDPSWDEHYAFLKCIKILVDEVADAQLRASDVVEVIGTMAWGIDVPHLTVTLEERGPCVIDPGIAKQLSEAVYQQLKHKGGWLRRAREDLHDMDRSANNLVDRIVRDCSRIDDDGHCCNDPDCAVTQHLDLVDRTMTSRRLASRANEPRKATAIEIAHWFRELGADSTNFKTMLEGFAREIEKRYHVEAEKRQDA